MTTYKGHVWYRTYLNSVEWHKTKQRFRQSKLYKGCCAICGYKKNDIHHKTYKRVQKERLTDLIALCRSCHDLVHEIALSGKRYNTWNAVKKVRKMFKKGELG